MVQTYSMRQSCHGLAVPMKRLILSRGPMFTIPCETDLTICKTKLSIHIQRTPLMPILVLIDVCPLVAHAVQYQPKCPCRTCAGVFSFHKHTERCAVICPFHCIIAERTVIRYNLRRNGNALQIGVICRDNRCNLPRYRQCLCILSVDI